MNVGFEWLIDATGCRPDRLADAAVLREVCNQLISQLDLHVIGEGVWHTFSQPGGVTGLYLLTESHLACHTYPESGMATFNLYCCRPRPCWPWEDKLRELLGADRVTIRSAARGDGEGGRA
jgi:S-adenosylmethionine decarboxylase